MGWWWPLPSPRVTAVAGAGAAGESAAGAAAAEGEGEEEGEDYEEGPPSKRTRRDAPEDQPSSAEPSAFLSAFPAPGAVAPFAVDAVSKAEPTKCRS